MLSRIQDPDFRLNRSERTRGTYAASVHAFRRPHRCTTMTKHVSLSRGRLVGGVSHVPGRARRPAASTRSSGASGAPLRPPPTPVPCANQRWRRGSWRWPPQQTPWPGAAPPLAWREAANTTRFARGGTGASEGGRGWWGGVRVGKLRCK